MTFHERLKEYRSQELNILSKEAAERLGISEKIYSHYETGRTKFPTDLLPLLKEKFVMSDTVFLDMVLLRSPKKDNVQQIVERTQEIQELYKTQFAEDIYDFIRTNPKIRTFLLLLKNSDKAVYHARMKELSEFMKHAPSFKNSTVSFSSNKTLKYKLQRANTFTLIDTSPNSNSKDLLNKAKVIIDHEE